MYTAREQSATSSTQNTQNTDQSTPASQGDRFVEHLENLLVKASVALCLCYIMVFYILPSPLIYLLFVDTIYLSSFAITKIKGELSIDTLWSTVHDVQMKINN